MTIYEKNIQALEEYHADLCEALKELKSEKILHPEIVKTKDGSVTIKVNHEGKEVFLYSQYSPQNEAVKFVKQYDEIPDYAVMIFLGIGNGQIIRELIKEKGKNVHFLFYEPSIEIFQLVLETYDITDILKEKRVFLHVKELNSSSLTNVLQALTTTSNYRICYYDVLPKYKKIFPKDSIWLEKGYRYAVVSVQSNIATMQATGKEIGKNGVQNLKYILKSNCEEDFAGVFPLDFPVVIVAAGPSLEKNVHVLKQVKGHAFIIAVDTALRYLVEQDVYPDLAVAVDPHKPLQLFENPATQQIPLAIASTLNYEAVTMMSKGKLIYAMADGPYYDKLYQLAGKNIYLLPNGGSVATVGVAMALNWGFRRIILVGQDLALGQDKVHAGKDDVDLEKLDGDKIAIEGYYGDTVYTTKDYNLYKAWYEVIVERYPEIEIINATEGGAKIHGVTQMSLQEVKDKYCQDNYDFEGVIRNMPPTFDEEQAECVKNVIRKGIQNLNDIERMLKDGLRECEEGLRIIRRNQFDIKKIQKINKKINTIIQKTTKLDEIYYVDCMVPEEEDILGDIFDVNPDNEQEYSRLLEKLYRYMSAMQQAVSEVKDEFEGVILQL